ncbi:MAG: hypothetical protein GYB64_07245 [Chloroflexi bacterium]|nr:hypothetical protein [Chloroflexota bacterium]
MMFAADIAELIACLRDYAAGPVDWDQHTGDRPKDWNRHETLAHLVSVAVVFNRAAEAARDGSPLVIEGITRREDLRAWNTTQIAHFVQDAPSALLDRLEAELRRSATLHDTMPPEAHDRTAFLRIYNHPARAIDFLDWQLSHAAAVHAAQITRPALPLWQSFSEGLIARNVDRFMRHFRVAYWPEYGGGEHVALDFAVNSVGTWHLTAAPSGGGGGKGPHPHADHRLVFARPEVLFAVFTRHTLLPDALRGGDLTITGDARTALDVLSRFTPAPPR